MYIVLSLSVASFLLYSQHIVLSTTSLILQLAHYLLRSGSYRLYIINEINEHFCVVLMCIVQMRLK